jgi:hypothetical protein
LSRQPKAVISVSSSLAAYPGSFGQTLWRITADFRLKFAEIDEDIGLAPKVIGNHGGLRGNGRDHRNADAAARLAQYPAKAF